MTQVDSRVESRDFDRGRRTGCSSARHEQGGQTTLRRSDGKAAPGRLISARCNDGLPLHGLWPLADHSRMYVALENKDVVSDIDERYEVARGRFIWPVQRGSEQDREPRETVDLGGSSKLRQKATGRRGRL